MKLLDLIYPPFCLHCKNALKQPATFCIECLDSLRLISKENRCKRCFAEESCLCVAPFPFQQFAFCFEERVATTLWQAFLKDESKKFCLDIASCFVIQLHALGFSSSIHLITTLPNLFKNPQYLVYKQVAKMLGVPFQILLKRQISLLPSFSLKKKCNIINQFVLLLGDSMQSLKAMQESALLFLEAGAKSIYGMTFCGI